MPLPTLLPSPGQAPRLPPIATVTLRLLERWHRSLPRWLHPFEGGASTAAPGAQLAYYGTGNHTTWSVQANATTFSALATLAMAPGLDEDAAGASREEIGETALRIFRFILATHKSGGLPTTSGEQWGHSWISVLGFTRMLHAVHMMKPHFVEEDFAALRRFTLSESDFLLSGYPVVAAIDAATGRNKPESNIWNGTLLHRAAALYHDAPNAARYREKSTELLLNGISTPLDAGSGIVYAGRPLREWHIGPNFTREYGLHHHHYLNVGYMVICLSNIAMAHFACEDEGIAPPRELYHNAAELWAIVKKLTFDDGRLWRIGGDTRVRYCYCQDYAIPMWLLARDLWGDCDAMGYLRGWLGQVASEQEQNSDGGFLTSRLSDLARLSPLYYCRLEGDRAGTLSMAACWGSRIAGRSGDAPPSERLTGTSDAWSDAFHGASMVRGRRLASWVWKGASGPLGTVIPADCSDMVEWQWNLTGFVAGAGCLTRTEPESWVDMPFAGGFLTHGSFRWVADENPSEGSAPEKTVRSQVVFAALPDDATILLLQQAQTLHPTYLREAIGLNLRIPNDLANKSQRTYRFLNATHHLAGASASGVPPATLLHVGKTLDIDGRLNVTALYGGDLALRRSGRRQITLSNQYLQHSGQGGNLHCDEVIIPSLLSPAFHRGGAPLYDVGVAITVDGAPSAISLEGKGDIKSIIATGQDGRRYLLLANFSPKLCRVALPKHCANAKLLSQRADAEAVTGALPLPPGSAALLVLP